MYQSGVDLDLIFLIRVGVSRGILKRQRQEQDVRICSHSDLTIGFVSACVLYLRRPQKRNLTLFRRKEGMLHRVHATTD